MQLRYYQTEAIEALWRYFEEHEKGNPIVAMPTGTGKSVVIGEFVKRLMQWPNVKVMMLTHVKELIAQNEKALRAVWPQAPTGVYSAGLKRRQFMAPITYAGIASVKNKADLFGVVNMVLIDECHLVSPNGVTMYRKFIADLLNVNPKLRVVGFSATPYRTKGGIMTDEETGLFTDIAYDITQRDEFNRLIDEKFLCPLVPKRTDAQLDVEGVKTHAGDYVQKQLQEAVDKEEITRAAVDEIMEHGWGKRKHWLVFASGIEHSEHVATELKARGVRAAAVHAKMKEDRDEILAAFKSGQITALVNNNVLTTGFDFPAIDLIAVLRPSRSPGLWVQMLGRGTRPHPSKENTLVLDFAGNTLRLGPINDPVIPGRRKKGIGGAPVRVCPECDTIHHISLDPCPECGHKYPPPPEKIKPQAGTEELIARPKEPELARFVVSTVTYQKHISKAGFESLKVTYHTCGGVRLFDEWVHFEGQMAGLGVSWWTKRFTEADGWAPDTVDTALKYTDLLRVPDEITVLFAGRWPRVHKCHFLSVTEDQELLNECPF